MPWARLDDASLMDAKLTALTDAAYRVWVGGLIWAARNLTDGHVPDHAITMMAVRGSVTRAVAELTAAQVPGRAPLWAPVDGGYQIHDYLDWNDSRATILAARQRTTARQQAHRSRVASRVTSRVTDGARDDDETGDGRVPTYHVPQEHEKQERDGASKSPDDPERIGLIRQHRRRRSGETDTGRPADRVIAALARDVLRRHPDEKDEAELKELLKTACAKANLQYHAGACSQAIDVARAQLRRSA